MGEIPKRRLSAGLRKVGNEVVWKDGCLGSVTRSLGPDKTKVRRGEMYGREIVEARSQRHLKATEGPHDVQKHSGCQILVMNNLIRSGEKLLEMLCGHCTSMKPNWGNESRETDVRKSGNAVDQARTDDGLD